MVHKQSAEEKLNNLNRLLDYTDAAYYLFKQEIPHTTHYTSLLELVSRLDGSRNIQHFMDSSPHNASYRSHATATELLDAVSQWLKDEVLAELCSSPYIAVLADEATDIRLRTELSLCFRYLVDGCAVGKFFCLLQLQCTTAISITEAILDRLQKHNIPLEKIFWLALDGASNMSGTKNGVQARLKTELRNAR